MQKNEPSPFYAHDPLPFGASRSVMGAYMMNAPCGFTWMLLDWRGMPLYGYA